MNLAWYMACHVPNMVHGRPGGIRTPITRIWSPVLYPLELLACISIWTVESREWNVDRNIKQPSTFYFPCLFRLFMNGMFTTEPAIFLELQLIRSGPLILSRRIVPPLTLCTGQSQNIPHQILLNGRFTLSVIRGHH